MSSSLEPEHGSQLPLLPFQLTVNANVKHVRYGGRLTILPGAITFTARPLLKSLTGVSEVVHRATTVRLIQTRAIPPWINTSLVLNGTEGTVVITTSAFNRKRLRRALQDAGFSLAVTTTWFSRGGHDAGWWWSQSTRD